MAGGEHSSGGANAAAGTRDQNNRSHPVVFSSDRMNPLQQRKGEMAMGTVVELKSQDGFVFPAYVAEPASKPRGAIVVLQEIFGVQLAHPLGGGPRGAKRLSGHQRRPPLPV